jgi:hypothetical protein
MYVDSAKTTDVGLACFAKRHITSAANPNVRGLRNRPVKHLLLDGLAIKIECAKGDHPKTTNTAVAHSSNFEMTSKTWKPKVRPTTRFANPIHRLTHEY